MITLFAAHGALPISLQRALRQGGLLRAEDDVIKLSLFWREFPFAGNVRVTSLT